MREEFTVEEVSLCLHGLLQEKGHDVELEIRKSRFYSRIKGSGYKDPLCNFAISVKGDENVILHRSWLLTLDSNADLERQVIEFLIENEYLNVL